MLSYSVLGYFSKGVINGLRRCIGEGKKKFLT